MRGVFTQDVAGQRRLLKETGDRAQKWPSSHYETGEERMRRATMFASCLVAALGMAAWAKPPKPGAPPPAPPYQAKKRVKPVRVSAKLVSADLEKRTLQIKTASGQVMTLRSGDMTVLFRSLKVVDAKEFGAKPGEPLVVCYMPGVQGGPGTLLAVFDQKSTVLLREIERGPMIGLLERVQFKPARIWVRLPNKTLKSWPLVAGPFILKGMEVAKFRGDPALKPPKPGEKEQPNLFEPGKDTVYVVTTLDGKQARIVMDWWSYSLVVQLAGFPAPQLPPQPAAGKT